MYAFAQDEAGNAARADFDRLTFPKPFKKSRIPLEDKFIERVVPAILEMTNEVNPQGSTIEKFVVINSELRRKNAEKIASYASQSAPEILWGGAAFVPFGNATRRSGVRGSADLRLRRQGRRPADASRLRPRARRQLADPGGKPRQGGARRAARHLRQHA